MTKIQKIVLGIVAVITVMLLFTVASQSKNLGGVYSQVTNDFADGISVDGTVVIDGSGNVDAPITTTSASTIGSDANGLNSFREVLTPSADVTLTASQSGTIVNMGVAGLDVTLPSLATSEGAYFRFVVSAAVATTDMTIISEADKMEGTLIVAGAVVDCDAENLLTFVIDGENVGDYVDLYSNGTNWFIGDSGVLTAAKLTCTSP